MNLNFPVMLFFSPVLEQEKLDKIIAFKQKHMDKGTKVGGVQVTLILRIPFAYIPENLLGKFASVTVQEHGIELLLSLTRQSSFYSYFKELDGISALSIEVLTHPPTNQPTSYAQLISLQSEDQIPDEDSFGQNFETVSHIDIFITLAPYISFHLTIPLFDTMLP